ncbi:RNA-binding protein [Sesbania bispinosa]|nr:RNA-binding protein [Sesbania bispinosa]
MNNVINNFILHGVFTPFPIRRPGLLLEERRHGGGLKQRRTVEEKGRQRGMDIVVVVVGHECGAAHLLLPSRAPVCLSPSTLSLW